MSGNLQVSFWVPTGSSFEDMPDGSLIVHGVPIMCEGSWTSMEGKTVKFSPQDLKANASNWQDNGIWTRHPLMPGENRPSDLCVGGVLNPTYVDSYKTVQDDGTIFTGAAVLGDLIFHRQTDASKDAAVQIRLPKEAGGFRMTRQLCDRRQQPELGFRKLPARIFDRRPRRYSCDPRPVLE